MSSGVCTRLSPEGGGQPARKMANTPSDASLHIPTSLTISDMMDVLGGELQENDTKEGEQEKDQESSSDSEARSASSKEKAHCTPANSNSQASNSVTTIACFQHRDNDAEFNKLQETAERLQEQNEELLRSKAKMFDLFAQMAALHGVSLGCDTLQRNDAPAQPLQLTQKYDPLDQFALVVMTTRVNQKGQEIVPGGNANATRLGTSGHGVCGVGIFPHVMYLNDDGETIYLVENLKKATVKVKLVRKEYPDMYVTEKELIVAANKMPEFQESPLTSVDLEMRLKLNLKAPDGNYTTPWGIGQNKTFQKPLSNDVMPHPLSQLLNPPENVLTDDTTGAFTLSDNYRKSLSTGCCSFHFEVRSGVSSFNTVPRNSGFIIEVALKDPRLASLVAYSVPFKIKHKFNQHKTTLQRGEVYIRGPDGLPVRDQTIGRKKRGRSEEEILLVTPIHD